MRAFGAERREAIASMTVDEVLDVLRAAGSAPADVDGRALWG